MTRPRVTVACTFCLLVLAGTLLRIRNPGQAHADVIVEQPPYIELTGIVRDFRERTATMGHPDFERKPAGGFAQYMGNVDEHLGSNGKPVFTGGGRKVVNQWKDSAGRPISDLLYDAALGDVLGTWGAADSGGIHSPARFDQWYRDVPGVNMSRPLTIKLMRQADGTYVFDDKADPEYAALGGFFPIDEEMFGNSGGSPDHNFHFTFELHGEFVYDAGAGQFFRFVGDDDIWVFIDSKMVIDLGGVHSAREQYVDANRLGMTDGETYHLAFFFAERHRTQCNFLITTNLPLVSLPVPTVSVMHD